MIGNPFSDATLLLVGHGSTKCDDSAVPVYQHAAELRRRRVFAEVREAFWKIEPGIVTSLANIRTATVFVAPLFISEGFFTEEAIPIALGLRQEGQADYERTQTLGGRKIHYCRAVGTDPAMAEVVLARARGVIEHFPFPRVPRSDETSLFLAGHGTTKNENSRTAVETQARLMQERRLFADVHAVFMMERPEIGDCYDLASTNCIVVVPFFISDGQHVSEDIPILLGEPEGVVRERHAKGLPAWRNPTERRGKRIWYSASVGTEPVMADVILDRVKEEAGRATEALSGR